MAGLRTRQHRPVADEELIRTLFNEHGKAMLAYATRLTDDRANAEDVVQEALLRAWRHPDCLTNGKGSLRGWLLTVVRNIVTDGVRARNARPAEVGESPTTVPVERDHADQVVNTMVVLEALDQLSPEHRVVLEQLCLQGRSVAAAAEVLGIPPGTVKSRSHYALRALRERTTLLKEAGHIAQAENRAELARLAEEQGALRRVATLVARGRPPEQVFAAVVEEVGRLLPAEFAAVGRYESDGTMTTIATSSQVGEHVPAGRRWTLGGKNLNTLVFETGRPARIDSYADASRALGVAVRERGFGSGVGTPVIVEGRLWGVLITLSRPEQLLPAATEARLANFTELVASAIANAESRAELMASRARIAAAADETRTRIARDLHDGIQQRLVSLGFELRAAQTEVPPQLGELEGMLSRVTDELASVSDELREISHGIHPSILSEGGLTPALKALRRRAAVSVELSLHAERRLPEQVEVAAYYVVSEALTNAAKHAHASVVNIELHTHEATLQLVIRDDGIGETNSGQGTGLLGLRDRIEALGGTLEVTSPAGGGTALLIEVPLEDQSSPVSPSPRGVSRV